MTEQFAKKAEAWSARFSEPVSDLVKRYTASVFFDKRLALFDIQGSLAHAEMLAAQGIISAQDRADIERGLAEGTLRLPGRISIARSLIEHWYGAELPDGVEGGAA